jgi:RNA polymerase sigma factor (sigma-70 family)
MGNHNQQDDLLNDIIKRFNEGDEGAWKFIMDSYRDRMVTSAIDIQLSLRLDIDVAQAEDITQDAWSRLYAVCMKKHDSRFEHIGQIIKWIRVTQRYLLKNLSRKASVQRERPILTDDNGETIHPLPIQRRRPVEDHVIEREESSWIWSIVDQVLGEFDEVDQDIIIRRIVNDDPSRMIASSVGKPVEHVYRVTERAWQKLKSYGQAETFFLQVASLNRRKTSLE